MLAENLLAGLKDELLPNCANPEVYLKNNWYMTGKKFILAETLHRYKFYND